MSNDKYTACLILENGRIFEGKTIGFRGSTFGEIVFSTGMVGYQETLTDPSYYGQIVTQTFPLIGNYGINKFDFESDKCHLKGYIVKELCEYPSNFRNEKDLQTFLEEQNIVGISNIDTRSLTKVIRENGVMNGAIISKPLKEIDIDFILKEIKDYKIKDALKFVSNKDESYFESDNPKFNVVLFDFGYKHNIRKELLKRGCNVTLVPHDTGVKRIKELNPDGIMLSNGPGDPSENLSIIENLKEIMILGIPIFGICLGHQLLALANGGKTSKLKYGHRGTNQPVLDKTMDRVFITTQNHGYAVENGSIDKNIGIVSHINVNDKSCEGVIYKKIKAFTVQFHPEACSGPQDSAYLFDRFIDLMEGKRWGLEVI